jgi:hypothetical protein
VSWTPGSGQHPRHRSSSRFRHSTRCRHRCGPAQPTELPARPEAAHHRHGRHQPGRRGVPIVNGITLHVLGSNGTGTSTVTYTPPVVTVPPPPPLGTGSIQATINAGTTAPGSLVVLSAGTTTRTCVQWKPVKLQGLGPGGIVGAHELSRAETLRTRGSTSRHRSSTAASSRRTPRPSTLLPWPHPGGLPPFTNGTPRRPPWCRHHRQRREHDRSYDVPATGASAGVLSAARIDGLGLVAGTVTVPAASSCRPASTTCS